MYRVVSIVCGSFLLAACASTPDWMPNMSLDAFKPSPATEAIRVESVPAGAEAKVANQACRTPCSLNVPSGAPATVNFTLAGYLPQSERVEQVTMGEGVTVLQPNPVVVELTPAPPPPKPAKPAPKRRTTTTAPAKPASATTAAAPRPAAPSMQQSTPWPTPSQQ
jgi:hypothetical protein